MTATLAMDRMVVRTEAMETICKNRQAVLMSKYESSEGCSAKEMDELRRLINRRVCIVDLTPEERATKKYFSYE